MTAIKDAFKGKTPTEARDMLEANCELKEKQILEIPLTDEELNELRTELAENSAKAYALEVEKKKITDKFKIQLKPLHKLMTEQSAAVHRKSESIEAEVYGLADQEEGLMHFYMSDGKYLNSRRLLSTERQLRIAVNNQ